MAQRAILLLNLGSPDSTSVPDVKRYLREFLGDERVIDRPGSAFLRSVLVNGIIIPFRAKNSAHGPKKKRGGEEARVAAELSDVIIAAATLANSLGNDLTAAFAASPQLWPATSTWMSPPIFCAAAMVFRVDLRTALPSCSARTRLAI